ncbi:MAG: DUF4091 domain-containing protein [Planctomycetia bacterium]|nr:DUF4091 domain-containing protein [Planctomycetia bacterium]
MKISRVKYCVGIFCLIATFAYLALTLTAQTSAAEGDFWNNKLSLDGKGYWKKRVPVEIVNNSEKVWTGEGIYLAVGAENAGDTVLPLLGEEITSLRLCNETGQEYLFDVVDSEGKSVRQGKFSEDMKVFLPVICPEKGKIKLFFYFDNDQAWRLPDWFNQNEKANDAEVQRLQISVAPLEIRELKENKLEKPYSDGRRYAEFFATNEFQEERDLLVSLPLAQLEALWSRTFENGELELRDSSGQVIECFCWEEFLLARITMPAQTREYFYVSETGVSSERVRTRTIDKTLGEAFPGTMIQTVAPAAVSDTVLNEKDVAVPESIMKSNLIANGDMEAAPDEQGQAPFWVPQGQNESTVGRLCDPENTDLGRQALELTSHDTSSDHWHGWTQTVDVQPGNYFLGAVMANGDEVPLVIHYHQKTEQGQLASGGMASVFSEASEGVWTLISGHITVTPDTKKLEIHLTNNVSGTVRYDNVFLVGIEQATFNRCCDGLTGIFQIPSIRKIFPDTTFDTNCYQVTETNPARISAACNEKEILQLGIRTDGSDPEQVNAVRVSVSSPQLQNADAQLPKPEVCAVGLVPVDGAMGYNNMPYERGKRFIPPGNGSDGWAGWWPDPIIPIASASNETPWPENKKYATDSQLLADFGKCGCLAVLPGKTRTLLLKFNIPQDAKPGLYSGNITLGNEAGDAVQTVPYTVQVFDVILPDREPSHAIYDVRQTRTVFPGESREEQFKKIATFLHENLITPDKVCLEPTFSYNRETGETTIDWTAFDAMAEWYFNELGVDVCYSPQRFYLFGWGLPPGKREGVEPYEGTYPWDDVDRKKLNAEYKKVYQSQLSAWWTHLKEKGWSDKFRLYISDEPFYYRDTIIAQMQALCDMIHEVDPAIPIYSSTWHHVPAWDGYIDLWGIGRAGDVPAAQIEKIKENGADVWWTTDGQLCLDTPYCAGERLLPWWCSRFNAEAYEFWGCDWYTYNPFEYGWHSYIRQSDTPGKEYMVRYPNGDGYLYYPGDMIGLAGIVSSIRLEQAREGQEDAKYFALVKEKLNDENLTAETKLELQSLYDEAMSLAPIPTTCGRYSTEMLPDPDVVESLHYRIGLALQKTR